MFSDGITRSIRTYIPILVGYLVVKFPFLNDVLDPATLTAFGIAVYWTAATLLEKWNPRLGFFLGVPKVTANTTATGASVPAAKQKL